jgi:hypothetical protein
MRKILFLFIICSLLNSCSTTKKISGATVQENASNLLANDGSSFEKAVVINEKSESKGVDAEYKWLRQNYPGYSLKRQALNFNKKKPYDIITILTGDGVEKKVYFDISKFFGKS